MNYEFHPFADVWELLQGDELQKLKESLKVNGQRLPIVLYEGKILDGRNRYILAKELGIKLRSEVSSAKNDDEAIEHVLDLNDRRKHRSYEERSLAGARLANLQEDGRIGDSPMTAAERKARSRKMSQPISIETGCDIDKNRPSISVRKAAKRVGVPETSIKRARSVIAHDAETGDNLVDKLKAGTIALTRADGLARAARRGRKSERKKNAPDVKAPPGKPPKLTTMQALAQRSALAKGRRILSREDVDPDFVGDAGEFAAKYGLVWTSTAHELAAQRFSGLALGLHQSAKSLKELVKGQRGDVEKLNKVPHAKDIGFLEEAIDYLKPLLAEAELWLQAAKRLRSDKAASPGASRERVTGEGRAVL